MGVDARRLRLLIVEDEPMVAKVIEDIIDDAGWQIVGPAPSVGVALELLQNTRIDGAVLDLNLGNGEVSLPVAKLLRDRGVPFFFASGLASLGQRRGFESIPVLRKPFRFPSFVAAVREHILTRA